MVLYFCSFLIGACLTVGTDVVAGTVPTTYCNASAIVLNSYELSLFLPTLEG